MVENGKTLPFDIRIALSSNTEGSKKPLSRDCKQEMSIEDPLMGTQKYFCAFLLGGSGFLKHYKACQIGVACPLPRVK